MNLKNINIGIIGLGQIGSRLYTEIQSKKKDIRLKTGINVNIVAISAKNGDGISTLQNKLLNFINTEKISENNIIVSNLRHHEQLELD